MSSLCLMDDPNFFVGEPDKVEATGKSTFQDVFRASAYTSDERTKRTPVICKNCRCTIFELVFNVACSVECALGYFDGNAHARDLIVNRFYTVKNYEELEDAPKELPPLSEEATREKLLTRYVNELYHPGDPRRSVYIKQIMENVVDTMSTAMRR